VYAVGSESTFDVEPSITTYAVAHYDGSGWTRSFATTDFQLNGVWPVAPNAAFAVASGGRILRYDGTAWTPMTSPTSDNFLDVWGNSASNVYAVGDGGILHFDGSTWSVANLTAGKRVWGTTSEVFVLTENSVLRRSGA
jgi:hypothetical protein